MWDDRLARELPLARTLAGYGLRLTRPRLAILQVLSQGTECMSANEIWQAARALYKPLGRATAFRTISQLVELGLLRPIHMKDSEQRYAVVKEGHRHLAICTRCGATVELAGCPLLDGAGRQAEAAGFHITGHVVEFFGLCHECQEA